MATIALAPRETPSEGSRAPHILSIVGALTGLSALLVFLRCYVRLFILRKFHLEDGFMIASLACAVGLLGCFVGESHHGVGSWSKDISPADSAKLDEFMFYHAIVIVLGISLVKISIGFFLLRFTSQNRILKWFIVGTLVFLALFTIACILALVFQCWPVEAAWDVELKKTGKCYSVDAYLRIGQFNSAINIITDFIFATLPVFMFAQIQVNKRTKLSVMGILSLGYFACAAGIVKTVLQSRVFGDTESYRESQYLIWNFVELAVGIIAASFPTIKPLVKSFIGSTISLTSGRRTKRTGHGYGYHNQSGYAMHSMSRSHPDREDQKYAVHIGSVADRTSGSSEENLTAKPSAPSFPPHIMQTTEVTVQSEEAADMNGRMGPKWTVDDRI
ncbi:hypothetical protein P170DRAFT_385163 [Aspergillus steynii IBT 23096]|uniref:Rhodopsin domain-containing protein n=1 Tax=Aspergillus steynii IBT 23096 TaxID=1392250 RepID=A0A2I2G3N2_9EURO|nr:uncharacterized protein P170DRAFT_385163 [Aspergillus steynii IBT 23096]PLB47480.1 hypothetical protein P170DRAFT_385163 [Aspergillus steynii IBT 23096]